MLTECAASPLTEPPQTPPPEVELTPKAAPEEVVKKRKEKKQIIDSVTELADGPGANVGAGLGATATKDVSDIVTEHPYLPRSSLVMRLLEIRDDPLSHFLPTKTTPQGTFFNAAPPGLAPELADMFLRPVTNLSAAKRRGASPEKPPSKKRRVDGSVVGDEEDVEQARRAGSQAPSIAFGSDVYGRGSMAPAMDFTFDNSGGMDDFQMDIPDLGGAEGDRARSKSIAPSELSRLSTPPPDVMLEEGDESHADVTCPIALFDDRVPSSQSQSQAPTEVSDDGKGYSKNTVKALAVIRRELQPNPEEQEEDKYMSFNHMAQKVRVTKFSVRPYLIRHPGRPPAVPRLHFSSSCSCSVLAIASSSLKRNRLRTSRCAPRTSYGRDSATALWLRRLPMASLACLRPPLPPVHLADRARLRHLLLPRSVFEDACQASSAECSRTLNVALYILRNSTTPLHVLLSHLCYLLMIQIYLHCFLFSCLSVVSFLTFSLYVVSRRYDCSRATAQVCSHTLSVLLYLDTRSYEKHICTPLCQPLWAEVAQPRDLIEKTV